MQTAYTTNMAIARSGLLADSAGAVILSRKAEAAMTFGLLAQQGTADTQVKPVAALIAADPDSITATPLASAATDQTITGASFDGLYGDDNIPVAQRLSFVLNNHGDWDLTTMMVAGWGPSDEEIFESIVIPNGGNTTLYSRQAFKRVREIFIPAQTGTNGTMYVGTDPTLVKLDNVTFPGIVLYDTISESYAATTEVAPYQQVSILHKGRVWVIVEAAVTDGMPCYVRMVEAGTDLRGQFRGTPAANFFPLPGAHFVTTQATVDGFAVLEIGG